MRKSKLPGSAFPLHALPEKNLPIDCSSIRPKAPPVRGMGAEIGSEIFHNKTILSGDLTMIG